MGSADWVVAGDKHEGHATAQGHVGDRVDQLAPEVHIEDGGIGLTVLEEQSQKMLFSVICGTTEPERLWIGASQSWQELYIDHARDVWRHVETRVPPPPMREGDGIVVPQEVRFSVPANGLRKLDLSGSNEAAEMSPASPPRLVSQYASTSVAEYVAESFTYMSKGGQREGDYIP